LRSPGLAFIELEFDTSVKNGAPLGDIASSLVTLHDLLRDLGTIAAYPSVEYREIQVVAIEMGSPLKITLSLQAIPVEAIAAFQEICRDLILARERGRRMDTSRTIVDLGLHAPANGGRMTDSEAQRLQMHVMSLHNAAVPLKRVVVRTE
jgi:hypothetical protein